MEADTGNGGEGLAALVTAVTRVVRVLPEQRGRGVVALAE
jgi:hypothetical protein